VESRHLVHAVAVRDSEIVAAFGDPAVFAFMRSAAKPLQALPLLRTGVELTDEEVAITCASHLARPEQLAPVRSLLARAGAGEDDLECGPDPTRLEHNCSGKHAGMLLLCRERGWPFGGYRLASHACQAAMRGVMREAAGAEPAEAVDGCGVVTFGLPLVALARAFGRLPQLEGGARACRAMQAHPELIRGPRSADVRLMRARPGWTAKGGAEGVLCAVSPEGLAVALKVADGATRASGPALAELLRRLGDETPELAASPLENSRGERVGELRAER
jgi:L-asparaginase II